MTASWGGDFHDLHDTELKRNRSAPSADDEARENDFRRAAAANSAADEPTSRTAMAT
jgi:hypothetical protein